MLSSVPRTGRYVGERGIPSRAMAPFVRDLESLPRLKRASETEPSPTPAPTAEAIEYASVSSQPMQPPMLCRTGRTCSSGANGHFRSYHEHESRQGRCHAPRSDGVRY